MNTTDLTRQSVAVLAGLAVWQLTVSAGVIRPSVLPPPSVLAANTLVLLTEERFLRHLAVTVERTLIASAIATVFGIVLGLGMGWSKRIRFVFLPPLSATFPLPVIALLPLIIIVFGGSERALIVTAALGGFYLAAWNAMNGARDINEIYFDVARDNGATSTAAQFREVLLPGALPLVFTGLRLCVSTVLLIVISIELIAVGSGIGYFLWVSWNTYALADLYAGVLVVGFLGVLITYGLQYVQSRLTPWKPEADRPLIT